MDLNIPENGILQLYTANETTNQNVWFDDFKVTFTPQLIVQENHYYPFGLELAGISKVNRPQHKFIYNGKEKQEEFGLNWLSYGQREYDAVLGRFNRIDRFAEKYYDLNPYNYTGNNPINRIDINGDSLWIKFGSKNQYKILYQDGQLSNVKNSDGSEYTGNAVFNKRGRVRNGFLRRVVKALNNIRETDEGGNLISELQSSENNFKISHSSFNNDPGNEGGNLFSPSNPRKAHRNQIENDPSQTARNTHNALKKVGVNLEGGSGGDVYWDPSGTLLYTTSGLRRNATTDLAHELFHGLDANRGLLDSRIHQGLKRGEWQAVYRENLVRQQMGQPLRTYYRTREDSNGTPLGGLPPRMLNPNNQPILPPWYRR